ncbi:hypothetical protein Dda_4547 [Drechslerella dactyloides]|uniref:SPX domain-containing protein n=1 Tax=Drechslerella dactyloides TaxID=74499 RepID=A0AAD6J1H7_DREDA|nr:hypothetical protein Dda_4547 [Drechslerella dactyloides]
MKFSHSIQFNAVPDWSSNYIAYSNLKKLIYTLEKKVNDAASTSNQDEERTALINEDTDPDPTFRRALDNELDKISEFYQLKELELYRELDELTRDKEAFEKAQLEEVGDSTELDGSQLLSKRKGGVLSGAPVATSPTASSPVSGKRPGFHSESESDASDDELISSGSGVKRRKRASTVGSNEMLTTTTSRLKKRNSMTFDEFNDGALTALYDQRIALKKRAINLYVSMVELKSFAQLNRTGFSKALKKFDKILNRNLREKYLSQSVASSYPFREQTSRDLGDGISRMEEVYADLATNGDIEAAKKELRLYLREHVVWERNTVWREMIGIERKAQAANVGAMRTLLGTDVPSEGTRRQGDESELPEKTKLRTPLGTVMCPRWLLSSNFFVLVIATAIFLALIWSPTFKSPEQRGCFAILVFASILWATEVIPLFVTSLMIPFFGVVLRVCREDAKPHARLEAKAAAKYIFAAMWTPAIMLLLGGFTIAAALSKYHIAKLIATKVLSMAGTKPRTVLLTVMFVATVASMLISNVAAPVLCYSLIRPMLRNLPAESNMSKSLILGIALASNVGGMVSPIASPQNIIALQNMKPEPSWGEWFVVSLPVSVLSILAIWLILLITFQPGRGTNIVPIRPMKDPFTGVQWFISIVTVATIVLWCLANSLENEFGDMGVVAIIPIVMFFGTGILTKEDFNNFLWTIIILAAGGLALGKVVTSSGLLHTIVKDIHHVTHNMGLYGVMLTFAGLILVFATFISHMVAALIILPIVAQIGVQMEDPHPRLLVMASALMCSAAMGLPTSGFPNMTAIMMEDDQTGQRYLRVKHFISRGVPGSIAAFGVVVTVGYGLMLIISIEMQLNIDVPLAMAAASPPPPTPRDQSIIDIFNTLPSPSPSVTGMQNVFHAEVLETLLDDDIEAILGLRTKPFRYQRRSAALMFQREQGIQYRASEMARNGDDGVYDSQIGGILAEEMGSGKTLICLLLVLASRYLTVEMPGHVIRRSIADEPEETTPDVVPDDDEDDRYIIYESKGKRVGPPTPRKETPPPSVPAQPPQEKVPSLLTLSVRTIMTHGVPWRDRNPDYHHRLGNLIREQRTLHKWDSYEVVRAASSRLGFRDVADVYLSSATLVVVPGNLMIQWEDEILKHTFPAAQGGLAYAKVSEKSPIPDTEELLNLDILLISRARFDKEIQDGADDPRPQQTVCKCPRLDGFYKSPLMTIHWKRIIVDEGHSMASSRSNSVLLADKLHVQSKWAVTGTPSSGLYSKTTAQDAEIDNSIQVSEASDLRRIGDLITHFLKLPPYDNRRVRWPNKVSEAVGTGLLRSVLERVMIRHRIADIENEVALPPLHQKFLATNEVTSERCDQDWMFHPTQRRHLNDFVNNMRECAFYWTGVNRRSVREMRDLAVKYLEKEGKVVIEADRELLRRAVETADTALRSQLWKTYSVFHEMGYCVNKLPETVRQAWAMDPAVSFSAEGAVLGGAQIMSMQKLIAKKAYSGRDLTPTLANEGDNSMPAFRESSTTRDHILGRKEAGEITDTQYQYMLHGYPSAHQTLHSKQTKNKRRKATSPKKTTAHKNSSSPVKKGILKQSHQACEDEYLAADSPLRDVAVAGFASAKLAYLVSKVLEFQATEKILIFYETDQVAFYIAEALSVVGVKYLLYSRTGLDVHRKAEYLVTFNTTDSFRVFLLDVSQAAQGIHLGSASRVFFVNPIWQPPSVLAQAMKRAHRIGQTRPVYVETLILKGTIEETIFNRKNQMDENDFRGKKLMVDDEGLRNLLVREPFADIVDGQDELFGRLETPQRMFGEGKVGDAPEHPDLDIVTLQRDPQSVNGSPAPPSRAATPVVDVKKDNSMKPKKRVGFAVDDEDGNEDANGASVRFAADDATVTSQVTDTIGDGGVADVSVHIAKVSLFSGKNGVFKDTPAPAVVAPESSVLQKRGHECGDEQESVVFKRPRVAFVDAEV